MRLSGPSLSGLPRELPQVAPDDLGTCSVAVLTLLRRRELHGKTRAANANRLERRVVDGFAEEVVPGACVAASVQKRLESLGSFGGQGPSAPPGQPHDERDDGDERGEYEESDRAHVHAPAYRRALRRGRGRHDGRCTTGGRPPEGRRGGSGPRGRPRFEPVVDTRDAFRGREGRSAELECLVG